MECAKKDTCANHDIKCKECWSMGDIYNPHPCYLQKPIRIRLGASQKIKLIESTDTKWVEQLVNDFIKNKEVVDIQYQAVTIARPPYVSDRVMIIYKEEG